MTAHLNSRRSKLRFKRIDLPLYYLDIDLLAQSNMGVFAKRRVNSEQTMAPKHSMGRLEEKSWKNMTHKNSRTKAPSLIYQLY